MVAAGLFLHALAVGFLVQASPYGPLRIAFGLAPFTAVMAASHRHGNRTTISVFLDPIPRPFSQLGYMNHGRRFSPGGAAISICSPTPFFKKRFFALFSRRTGPFPRCALPS